MPDPTDPRAVADDPSGIVQQMPEARMPDQNNSPERIWLRVTDKTVMARKPSDADEYDVEYIRADRAAPEGKVRAEVERFRAALRKINVGDGWAALIARAALSPETDGGQDG